MTVSYVITFKDYVPSPRDDGVAWTQAQILESADNDSFTLIDTIPLSPLDTDPTQPAARTFTTDKATLEAGWYQVVFLDDSNGQSPAAPVYRNAVAPSFSPSVEDVAALVPSRAKGQYGRITTFDSTTQPTGTQVQAIIDRALRSVYGRIGTPVPALNDMATDIVAMRAAMLVELTFFGDQIKSDRSPFAALQELYEEALTDYFAARGQLGPDQTPGTADDQIPYYSSPRPVEILVAFDDYLDVIEGSGPVDAGGSELSADPFGGGPLW